MKYLYEGFRSIAYTEDYNIILVGKNKQATITYEQDYKTYKMLEGKINTVQIPSNVEFINPNEKYKFGALKYKMIQGKVFKDEEKETYKLKSIANSLGNFLSELHFLTKDYDEVLVSKEKELILENIELLKDYLNEKEINTILKFKDKYFEYISTPQDLVFTHGDLWYENYILDESGSKLVGIIDFENSKYFFRVDDFVSALYISEEFLNDILETYSGQITIEEVKMFFARREISSFKYMLEYESKEEIEEQIEKIRNLDIFI